MMHYFLLKSFNYFIAKGSVETSLNMLHEAVLADHRYLLKAASDGDFQKHTKEFREFVNKLRLNAKPEAEAALNSAQLVINEMKDWHAHESAPVQFEGALSLLLDDARRSFQTESYLGFLDALLLSNESANVARQAIDIQINHMEQSINTLKERVQQLWNGNGSSLSSVEAQFENSRYNAHEVEKEADALYRRELTYFAPVSEWAKGGDFAKFRVGMYAYIEVSSVQQQWRDASRSLEHQTFESYKKAQSHLRECLKVGLFAVEHSIASLESETLGRMRIAFILACLWPLVLPVFFSFQIWDWERVIPLDIQEHYQDVGLTIFWVLLGLIFLPITIIGSHSLW